MGKKNKKKILKRKNKVMKKENNMLRETILQKEKIIADKSTYLSNMSHDIRTCINGIIGMTGIALNNCDNAGKMYDCLKKIDNSSQYLISLVNDILDMGRIENEKMLINHEPIDIRQIINHCSMVTEGLLAQRKVELIREFGNFKNPMLIGDELHLNQILINILGNSVKFTPDGGKIYFQVKEIPGGTNITRYHFEIEDTGIGMEQSFLSRIWEPFTQGNGKHFNKQIGSGLGLTITKKLVDLMEGVITVESTQGIGTRFTIDIEFDIDPDVQKTEIMQISERNLSGMKILLAEDNELNMEIAKTILEAESIKVTTAENGEIAVNIFSNSTENSFDAILMDIRMPQMDGLSATKVIRSLSRKDAKTIPIIAMTADAYDEDIHRTKEIGMNAHLTKPIQQERLFQTLSKFYSVSQTQK